MRYAPVAMSYSTPSGLTIGTIQISRELTMLVIRASLPYFEVSSPSRYSAISTVRCSRACWLAVNITSGSASSVATLSDTLSAQIARPW
jgi:hypothetical protein